MNIAINPSGEIEAAAAEVATHCLTLVPMAQRGPSAAPIQRLARPDPSFVAQLIATAEHAPQTCALRRATPAVAQAAYGSATDCVCIKSLGHQMQQII